MGVARNRCDQEVVEIECTVSRQCVNKKSQRGRGSELLCTPGSEALVRLGQRRVLFWTLFLEVVEVRDHKRGGGMFVSLSCVVVDVMVFGGWEVCVLE